jgi:hypothetical protein
VEEDQVAGPGSVGVERLADGRVVGVEAVGVDRRLDPGPRERVPPARAVGAGRVAEDEVGDELDDA